MRISDWSSDVCSSDLPADAGPELVALLRLLGGPFLGIAVLNWLSRDADPSSILPIVLANLVGFGTVAAIDAWGVASRDRSEERRDGKGWICPCRSGCSLNL